MIEPGDRVRAEDGREGVVESRLNGVWADLVSVRFADGTEEAIDDRRLEVLG